MADGNIDLLMRVVGPSGPFEAESGTQFTETMDALRAEFIAGEFCELREFDFSAGVAAALGKNKKDDVEKQKKAAARYAQEKKDREERAKLGREKQLEAAQQRIRELNDRRVRRHQKGDFVDMQPVEFTRVMDKMSPRLFKALVDCETLPKLSVVKRKSAGRDVSGLCYLRLDFEKVLITDLDWKDGEHVVLETATFIYRKVTLRYRPQNAGGSLGATVQSVWEMATA